MKSLPLTLTAALLFGSLSIPAFAQWKLDPAASTLAFVSVKSDAIGENHRFLTLSGAIEKEGTAQVDIDLNSVETAIPLRNERMQTMLFNTASFPTAKVQTTVDIEKLAALSPGEVEVMPSDLAIDLHGKQKTYTANLLVAKLSAKKILVTTQSPIIVNAADFDLVPGITSLKTIAALPSISTAVPVSVSLVFNE